MCYSIKKYRKDFSIWAAYRATQAGSAKAKKEEFIGSLYSCGVMEFLDDSLNHKASEKQFDKNHKKWVLAIRKYIKIKFNKKISYGIAAKLIAVFIKNYFIMNGKHNTNLAKVAHPPIDSFLLKGIDKELKTNLSKTYKWQSLDQKKYEELLIFLKKIKGNAPFWFIEKYWNLK